MSKQDTSVGRAWYAIHTYAGYENAVARNLRQRIESLGLQDKIFSVVVPTEHTVKIKGGRRVEEEEKVVVCRAQYASRHGLRGLGYQPGTSQAKRSR
jgi:transcription antitermination factor NusG